MIRVCNEQDLSELWSDLRKPGSKVALWCDGLKEKGAGSRKHAHSEDGDSEDERPSKQKKQAEKNSEVQEIVDNLKTKHGSSFSPMHFHIWAEMIAVGMFYTVLMTLQTQQCLLEQKELPLQEKKSISSLL